MEAVPELEGPSSQCFKLTTLIRFSKCVSEHPWYPVASASYLTVTESDMGGETQLLQPPEVMRTQVLRVETHFQQR